jgi:hypothetical protein
MSPTTHGPEANERLASQKDTVAQGLPCGASNEQEAGRLGRAVPTSEPDAAGNKWPKFLRTSFSGLSQVLESRLACRCLDCCCELPGWSAVD